MKFQGKKEMESEKVLRRLFAAAVSLSVNAAFAAIKPEISWSIMHPTAIDTNYMACVAAKASERIRLRAQTAEKYEARKDVIDFVSVGKKGRDYPAILAIALVRVPDAARKE